MKRCWTVAEPNCVVERWYLHEYEVAITQQKSELEKKDKGQLKQKLEEYRAIIIRVRKEIDFTSLFILFLLLITYIDYLYSFLLP